MTKLIVKIPRKERNKLLSRAEILHTDGVYHDESIPHLRFVVSQAQCFIFGDGCPLYKSDNPNLNKPRYIKVDEKIVFQPI